MHDPMIVAFEIRRPWPLTRLLGFKRDENYALVRRHQAEEVTDAR